MDLEIKGLREDIEQLRRENVTLRQKISDLEQNDSIKCSSSRVNTLEYEHNKLCGEVSTLKLDTERCLDIVADFQTRTVEYLHYLEDEVKKSKELKPILIIGNKEVKTDESNIS